MIVSQLDTMRGGWFVGAFTPSCLPLDVCEVAIKHYRAGDYEAAHVHRVATELTAIVQGRVEMNGRVLVAGDIATLAPGEAADFRVLEDCITVVVKSPSVAGDKYIV
jgi:anti-sigma factor ChrR (cupin superfamily)